MVQGNWQRRVEKAEARRTEAKQREQQKGSRGVYKAQVLELFAWLDNPRNSRNLGPTEQVMQIWVDSKPSGVKTSLDQDDFAITRENVMEGKNKEKATPKKTGKQKKAHLVAMQLHIQMIQRPGKKLDLCYADVTYLKGRAMEPRGIERRDPVGYRVPTSTIHPEMRKEPWQT
jgi:hypothetical protein